MPRFRTYEPPPEGTPFAEKVFCLDLLKAVSDLESHLESGFFDFGNWQSYDGMGFMGELQRACARLVDKPEGKLILPQVFAYLETKATELELNDLGRKELSRAERHAVWFLIFTFTDNPTGKDPEFPKLAPFMGPKILKHCTIC